MSTRVKDETGSSAFSLINKATGQALRHAPEDLAQVFFHLQAPNLPPSNPSLKRLYSAIMTNFKKPKISVTTVSLRCTNLHWVCCVIAVLVGRLRQ